MPGPVGEAPPTTSPHRQSALLDEIRIMPPSGVVGDRGVSQRLGLETHHLGFSYLPGAGGTVGWLFSTGLPQRQRRSTPRDGDRERSAGAGARLAP